MLTACFQGGAQFSGSCDAENHQVIKAVTNLNAPSLVPSSSNVGQLVTASASAQVLVSGAGNLGGTITVSASANEICTISLPATSCQLTLTTAGLRAISFNYPGDANFNASSRVVNHEVIDNSFLFANGFE